MTGWLIKLPSIILLLVAGIIAGPIYGLLEPDKLLGQALMPFIELAVALILFEGGLSLKGKELGKIGSIALRLVTIAALITWVMLGFLAYYVLGLSAPMSALLGAILVVSGPTVVIPLIRVIRVRMPVEPILRWEGILIDPIGVILAVLVAEVCETGIDMSAPVHIFSGILLSLGIGISLGFVASATLKFIVGRHLVPDQFNVLLCIALLFSFVTLSNALHDQSGLLTSTIMGLSVATSRMPWVKSVEEYIGHTQRLFIGILFILLAGRLSPEFFDKVDIHLCIFIMFAILVVRPIAVFFSTTNTKLGLKHKLAIGLLAPRGIVSAALASSLSISLASSGLEGVEYLVPYTFATIISTVAFYGIFSPIIFKLLGVVQDANEGVLFVGGGKVALEIAKVIKSQGFKVAFVDTNVLNIRRIVAAQIDSYRGSILSDPLQDEINLEGIGNILAFTSNDEANSLAAIEYRHTLGAAHVFQLAASKDDKNNIGGRIFANKDLTLDKFNELWTKGYRPKIEEIIKEKEKSKTENKDDQTILLAEIENNKLYIVAEDKLARPLRPTKKIVFSFDESVKI